MAVDATIALVSLVETKAFLQITESGEDTILESLIDRMSKEAAKYCGRKSFVSTEETEFYDGDGGGDLVLKRYPVISVASVNDDPSRAFSASTDIPVAANIMIDKGAGILRLWNLFSSFAKSTANIKVVYTAGYATIPGDVKHACLLMILNAYKRHYQDQKIGIQSESYGDRQLTYSDRDIPKPAAMILNHYKARGWADRGFTS